MVRGIMHAILARIGRESRSLSALAVITAAALPSIGFAASAEVQVERGTTRKICQVTGETDRQTGQPTINRTESRFKFWGTDLGASFEHEGKLVFLFGDTHAAGDVKRLPDRDLIAVSDTHDPEDCIKLDVLTDEDGGYRPLSIATVEGGLFSVPSGGFSANGRMYVVATADHSEEMVMGRSVLASSEDGGRNFRVEYNLSTGRFINIAAASANAATVKGLPAGMDDAVLLWGSGRYRKSDAYLAVLPESRPDDRSGLRYFAGLDSSGMPVWSTQEADSRPLFDQPCIGELSVAWNEELGKWVMLYNCGDTSSQILARTSDRPWGPWSAPQVLFDAVADRGFCNFMHAAEQRDRVADEANPCAIVSDPHSPETAGDPYAPYLIAKFSRGVKGNHSDIYFMMSTWNPYNVVLMTSRLRFENGHEARHTATMSEPG